MKSGCGPAGGLGGVRRGVGECVGGCLRRRVEVRLIGGEGWCGAGIDDGVPQVEVQVLVRRWEPGVQEAADANRESTGGEQEDGTVGRPLWVRNGFFFYGSLGGREGT